MEITRKVKNNPKRFSGGGGYGRGAWNRHDLANWRSHSWTERFFNKICRFSVISHYAFKEKPANWHSGLETVLIFHGLRGGMLEHVVMAKALVLVLKNAKILQRTNRASRPLFAQKWTKLFHWTRLKSHSFGPKMLLSAVRAPICQIVPVSRVYGGGIEFLVFFFPCEHSLLFDRFCLFSRDFRV